MNCRDCAVPYSELDAECGGCKNNGDCFECEECCRVYSLEEAKIADGNCLICESCYDDLLYQETGGS